MNNNNDNTMSFNIPKKTNNNNQIIKVIGVGGGGGNAVDNMYAEGIENVGFIIANTDLQVLEKSEIKTQIQLGQTLTEGLGAGNNPEVGKNAAIESKQEISDTLNDGTKMIFVTAGMGGGTGTGAAPVIAQIAKDLGILTIGVVSIPFEFEGEKRIKQAIKGLNELKQCVDSMIIINNEKISEEYKEYSVFDAFKYADQVLTIAVKGIAEIITKEGRVNVDFADVKSVMENSGVAVMGTGKGEGNNRAIEAVEKAITSPLLNNNDIKGAKNLLVNIISPCKNEISTTEMDAINKYLQNKAKNKTENKANLIWGITTDKNLSENETAVTVIATDFLDNIIPEFEPLNINNNNKEKNNIKTLNNKNTEQQKQTQLSIEEIKNKIQQKKLVNFDFNDPKIVDKLHNTTAFERQNIKISNTTKEIKNNFFQQHNNNTFINPLLD